MDTQLTMPRYRLSEIEKNTVIYEIEVQTREAKWHLTKKYDEFVQLNDNLKRYYHNLPEVSNPVNGSFPKRACSVWG